VISDYHWTIKLCSLREISDFIGGAVEVFVLLGYGPALLVD
jgi:hypothetical protein